MTNRNVRNLLTALALIVLIIFLLSFKFPYKIEEWGKIVPTKEWLLLKGTDGRLIEMLYDYEKGVPQQMKVRLVERGDVMTFNLHENIRSGYSVNIGDTIGVIYSSEIEQDFADLQGELAVANSNLRSLLEGEKSSIISTTEQQYNFARKEVEEQLRIVERLEKLYKEDLAAKEQYEIELGRLRLAEIQVTIAESEMETAKTGAKSGQITLAKSQIASLENQIAALEKQLRLMKITAPVSGRVTRMFANDTLMAIGDTSEQILFMPIPLDDYQYLVKEEKVIVEIGGYVNATFNGTLIDKHQAVDQLNGKQILMTGIRLDKNSAKIKPGLMAKCVINCQTVSFWELLQRFFITSIE